MPKAKVATPKDQDLNRWCIEMAMRWPIVSEYGGNHGVYSAGGGMRVDRDADIIGRASKIMAWVKEAH